MLLQLIKWLEITQHIRCRLPPARNVTVLEKEPYLVNAIERTFHMRYHNRIVISAFVSK